MICTIRSLDELSQTRREREYMALAEKAVGLYKLQGNIPSVRDAILMVMGSIRVSGNESDIMAIEQRAALVR